MIPQGVVGPSGLPSSPSRSKRSGEPVRAQRQRKQPSHEPPGRPALGDALAVLPGMKRPLRSGSHAFSVEDDSATEPPPGSRVTASVRVLPTA
jgi:hypothetical protein